jgi:hypothetical protein
MQYAMARRTFDRLQQDILRDGRYLTNSVFMAEYSYWRAYFQSATAMDSHTFQRFTLWHSRFTQQARSVTRPQVYGPRRPEWRTLSEMLRVCERTSDEDEDETPPREPAGRDLEAASPLSIGVGVLRPRVSLNPTRQRSVVARATRTLRGWLGSSGANV